MGASIEVNMQLHKSRHTGDASPAEKVLGMVWRTEDDQLAVSIPKTDCPTSKRELLSNISKTFDPLGVLSPWLIGGKAQFQRTWKMAELGWDDPLPADLQKEVKLWWEDAHLHCKWFPRSLAARSAEGEECTFHVFCDASQLAYCAAVYLLKNGTSRLVMAKSRLAPIDANLTIPRMELMAALIGARLMKFIQEALQIQQPRAVFWTDSMDVLYWLWNNKPRKTFVDNRVSSILESTNREQWRHVKGTDNPADLGTRGLTISAVSDCEKWWEGPTHLMVQSQELQQPDEIECLSPEAQKETRAENHGRVTTVATTTPSTVQTNQELFNITSCSCLKQVVERTAWVRRFVHNARNKDDRISGMLTAEERQEALNFWIQAAQEQVYPVELE